MKYEKANAKIILFNNDDVITSSMDPDDPLGYCKNQGNSHHENCYNGKKPVGWQNSSATTASETYSDYWQSW